MLIAAAIVPGPPALVPDLMGDAAHELDRLRHAVDAVLSRAVSDLVAASADPSFSEADSAQLVVVGPGEPGEFDAVGAVSFAGFGRDVVVPALAGGDRGATAARNLPTPLIVARYLASRDVAAHPEHSGIWARARWMTTSGTDAATLGEELRRDRKPIALIVVADGATCHGPKAPRAEDSRAPAYEDQVCEALASGLPRRLAQIDDDLGRELGATGPQAWPVLIAASDGDYVGELVWRGAPYGVGWAVASWGRNPSGADVVRT